MQEYLRPSYHWKFRARELRSLARIWEAERSKAAMLLLAEEFDTLAVLAAKWRTGARVSRKDSPDLGTIVDDGEKIHVQWDGGRTSYFRRDKPGNVKLADPHN